MVIKDEMLGALRQWTFLKEVRTKFRSQSQLYAALAAYFEEIEEVLAKKCSQLSRVEEDLRACNMEAAELGERQAGLISQNEALSEEIAEKERVLEDLKGLLTPLQKRGFSL